METSSSQLVSFGSDKLGSREVLEREDSGAKSADRGDFVRNGDYSKYIRGLGVVIVFLPDDPVTVSIGGVCKAIRKRATTWEV